jgi:hypothetical protein
MAGAGATLRSYTFLDSLQPQVAAKEKWREMWSPGGRTQSDFVARGMDPGITIAELQQSLGEE